MAKLEYLNSFFIERLMLVAGEIFEAVKDTICEYEEEIERSKQENHRLRKILCEVNERKTAASADVRPSHAAQTPLEQISKQLDSDPSVLQLKLELASIKKEGDQTSHAVSQELPSFSQEPLDNHSSVIQVKVALSTIHQDVDVSSLQSPSAATADNEESPHHFSRQTLRDENVEDGPHNNSLFPVKLEPMDMQDICCNNTTAVMLSENMTNNYVEDMTKQSSLCPQQTISSNHFSFGNNFRQSKHHMVVRKQGKPRRYHCDVCGKCYGYAQVLENHRRTHTGERPYHCRFCGRCFKQKGHLNYHERIHTGEKPYNCLVCGRRFTQSGQLKRHVSIHLQVK